MKNALGKIAFCAAIPSVVLIALALNTTGIPFLTPLVYGVLSVIGHILKALLTVVSYVIWLAIWILFLITPLVHGVFVIKAKRALFGRSSLDWICGISTALAVLMIVFNSYGDMSRMITVIVSGFLPAMTIRDYQKYKHTSKEDLRQGTILASTFTLFIIILVTSLVLRPYSSSNTNYSLITHTSLIKLIEKGDEDAEKEFQFRVEEYERAYQNGNGFLTPQRVNFILNANVNMDEDQKKDR